ncbi:hypothetical protein BURK1_03728 [Burkholderiales bacterium]|nr:hypothetical protein BURK1_03728 [Burkholderiales bacterium]
MSAPTGAGASGAIPLLPTARLVLEPLVPGHAAEAFVAFADADLYAFMVGEPPASVDALRDEFARLAAGCPRPDERWVNWLARRRDDASLVGWHQATVAGARADIAWVTFAGSTRRGHAREGAAAVVAWLASLGVREIVAQSDVRNAASCATAVSLGFVPDAETIAETLRGEPAVDRVYRLRLREEASG